MRVTVGFFVMMYERMTSDVVDSVFFFQAEDGIRDLVRSRGLGDVYKRQGKGTQWSNCYP